MAGNRTLHIANRARKDEFYTQMDDITNELYHYNDHFRDKTVLCNCDDPYESNFFKYFALNFYFLGLKKLICTCWHKSPIAQTELFVSDDDTNNYNEVKFAAESPLWKSNRKNGYKIELTSIIDRDNDGAIDLDDVMLTLGKNPPEILTGTGDFRSDECKTLMEKSDIVVTNPPFSLFREYVAQLMEYKKKFIIIGSINSITYKEIFPLIKENKIWLGYGFKGGNAYFYTPYSDRYGEGVLMKDTGLVKFRNCCWFTNLDHNKRHEKLEFYKEYTPEEYPHYDNYDAIEVSKTALIPENYDGVMGVPISFLEKYCPEQFEIVKFRKGNDNKDLFYKDSYGKKITPYFRILIRRKL